MKNTYVYNDDLRIWLRSDVTEFGYSDGDAVEEGIYRTLKEVVDLSIASDELMAAIKDWPTEYHFSKTRHNLLRPFSFGPDDRILELGCGCGAITRQLGESGAKITAVEGSTRRASIAAERCRDLQNVKIYCDNILDFKTDEKFDLVTLIGVLEYSRLFSKAKDPIQECLRTAKEFLTENGVLVLAIENQLGLKYFNGCGEDHVGRPFYGINGLYGPSTVVTFGKKALSERLTNAGFKRQEFYYPFPDYKLPSVIVSDPGLKDARFDPGALLARSVGTDSHPNPYRAFNESLAMQVLAENGLIGDMANSFFVIAMKDPAPQAICAGWQGWLAKSFCSSRRSGMATENTFEVSDEKIVVRKKNLFTEKTDGAVDSAGSDGFHHRVSDSAYTQGRLYVIEAVREITRGVDHDRLAECFRPWLAFLKLYAIDTSTGAGEMLLPGRFADCIPFNLIIKDDGELFFFDDEWQGKKPIPLYWVLARGVVSVLSLCEQSPDGATYRQMLDSLLPRLGVQLDEVRYGNISALEEALQSACYGVDKFGGYLAMLDNPYGSFLPMSETLASCMKQKSGLEWQVAEKEKQLAEKDRNIQDLLGSMSWKVTAPLRSVFKHLK